MDLIKILAGLHEEYDHVVEAILTLERLAVCRTGLRSGEITLVRKRGRPLGSKNKVANVLKIPVS